MALQEVTVATAPVLRAALEGGGLPHVRTTINSTTAAKGPRAYGLLIASTYPLADHVQPLASPWPEKVLSTAVGWSKGPVEVHTVHVPPGSSNGWVKVTVLEALFQGLAVHSEQPPILCGDFNAPRCELRSGELVTWAQTIDGASAPRLRTRIRGGPAIRWDAAERNVLCGLRPFGMHDVYRALHGYEAEAASWVLVRHGRQVGRRFDHVFASDHLRPVGCGYLEEWRQAGLSDHAAIEAEFVLG